MAINAHGAVVRRNGIPIVGVRDIVAPALMRKATDRSCWLELDEEFNVGIRHYGELSFEMALTPTGDTTQIGLYRAWSVDDADSYDLEFADGALWSFPGSVAGLVPQAPVEGLLVVHVTIRPLAAVALVALVPSFLLQESGDRLLVESGGRVRLE